MVLGVRAILLIIACIFFLLAAISVPPASPRISWLSLGLLFFAGSFLVVT